MTVIGKLGNSISVFGRTVVSKTESGSSVIRRSVIRRSVFDKVGRSVGSRSVYDRTVRNTSVFSKTVFGRTMEMHEKKGNLQERWIGAVESIPGTYVGRECLWRNGVFIPLRFLVNLTLIFQYSLEDITVLVNRTSINGREETRGFGEPLFHHGLMCSKLCTNSTRKRKTDGP